MTREPTTKLLVILGPTATGKSDLAVSLAKMIEKEKRGSYSGAEIISADSRQVYRGMNIGTGKITAPEMRGIPHHLLDVADPRKQFSVIEWKKLAERSIRDIVARGKLPIICGGTGFYIDSLIHGNDFTGVGANEELRKQLSGRSATDLFDMLQKLDPIRAQKMNDSDSQNPRRLVRAIEIATDPCIQTAPHGPNEILTIESPRHINYEPTIIGLQLPDKDLRKRIHDRLLKRIDSGMLDEARLLHKTVKTGGSGLSWKRMDDLGLEYRFMAQFLQGKMCQTEMTERLEIAISQYAKRQMTWFKRNKEIRWFETARKTAGDILAAVSHDLFR